VSDSLEVGVIVDSCCKTRNFINSSVVESDTRIYPTWLNGSFEGGGRFISSGFIVIDSFCIKIKNDIIKTIMKPTKFFVIEGIKSEAIIGQQTIWQEDLYKVIELIDTIELGQVEEYEDLDNEVSAMTLDNSCEEDLELQEDLIKLVEEYEDIFATELEKEPADVTPFYFELKDDITDFPKALKGRERRQPTEWYVKARPLVQELLEAGVISRSNSTVYSHIHLAPKPNEPGAMRLTIDYKLINTITKSVGNVMPLIDSFLDWVAYIKPSYFCKMDLLKGYFQFPIQESCKHLTSFRFEDQIFQFNRLPMGLSQSVGYFQSIMTNEVLGDLTNEVAKVYIDDVLVVGHKENLITNLKKVFDRFREKKIRLKREKCDFGRRGVKFLGYYITGRGMQMTDEKMISFGEFKKPVDTTGIRRFLGSINYFRRFFKDLAKTALPLYKLGQGKKKAKVYWDKATYNAFEQLKAQAAEDIELRWPTSEGELLLFTDASEGCIGGWLGQRQGEKDADDEDVITPIHFFSKALSPSQRKWSVSDKEAFAILYGVLHLHQMLAGRKFTVFTDHKALLYMEKESASEKVERIKLKLSRYDITYQYIKGEDNIIADSLSRDFHNTAEEEDGKEIDAMVVELQSENATISAIAEDRQALLSYYHGPIQFGSRGHYAVEKTIECIRKDNMQWPGYEKEVKEFIENCSICQANRARRKSHHGLRTELHGEGPGDKWSIDMMEVGEDNAGFKYILVVIDNFTKWLTLRPTKTLLKEESSMHIWRILLEDGFPNEVRFDQGRTINNKFMKDLLGFLQVNGITTSARGHEENGIVERVIGEVREQLSKASQEGMKQKSTVDWHWLLPVIARNHNSNKHFSTGQVPAEMRFGHFNRIGGYEDQILVEEAARRALENKSEQKKRQNMEDRSNGGDIQPGQLVWMMNPRRDKRLLANARWLPGRIIGRAKDMCEVEYEDGTTVVNIALLRIRDGRIEV
jgi:hypothetical protein